MIMLSASEAREWCYNSYMSAIQERADRLESDIQLAIEAACEKFEYECAIHIPDYVEERFLLRVTSMVVGDLVAYDYKVNLGNTSRELVISWLA